MQDASPISSVEQLYENHHGWLQGWLNRRLGQSADAEDLARGVCRELSACREVDIVMCPPFISLKIVGDVVGDTFIKLGAQNMHWESNGAYTGEI